MKVRVQVAASAANLGPGFDALALALPLYNQLQVSVAPELEVLIRGEGSRELASGPDNMVLMSAQALADRCGRVLPTLRWELDNAIPVGRGLGSSAAARVAGLLAGNAVLGSPLHGEELRNLAAELEGHADNASAVLLGGLAVCAAGQPLGGEAGPSPALSLPWPSDLVIVLAVPDAAMATEAARRLLPASVEQAQAVYNLSRSALLVACLSSGRYELMAEAMLDALHQPYRAQAFPPIEPLMSAARRAGAWGSCLSGSGPSVLAISSPGAAPAVAAELRRTLDAEKVGGKTMTFAGAGIRASVEEHG